MPARRTGDGAGAPDSCGRAPPAVRRARPIETRADVAYAPSVRGSPWPPRGASGALPVYNKKEAPKASVPNG